MKFAGSFMFAVCIQQATCQLGNEPSVSAWAIDTPSLRGAAAHGDAAFAYEKEQWKGGMGRSNDAKEQWQHTQPTSVMAAETQLAIDKDTSSFPAKIDTIYKKISASLGGSPSPVVPPIMETSSDITNAVSFAKVRLAASLAGPEAQNKYGSSMSSPTPNLGALEYVPQSSGTSGVSGVVININVGSGTSLSTSAAGINVGSAAAPVAYAAPVAPPPQYAPPPPQYAPPPPQYAPPAPQGQYGGRRHSRSRRSSDEMPRWYTRMDRSRRKNWEIAKLKRKLRVTRSRLAKRMGSRRELSQAEKRKRQLKGKLKTAAEQAAADEAAATQAMAKATEKANAMDKAADKALAKQAAEGAAAEKALAKVKAKAKRRLWHAEKIERKATRKFMRKRRVLVRKANRKAAARMQAWGR